MTTNQTKQVDREPVRVAEPKPWKPWLFASLAAGVLVGVAVGLMDGIGLFELQDDETGMRAMAAALALVGVVLSASITLVGIIVKFAIDDRNARLSAIESERNFDLAREAERRNRIEVAIRAVSLLGENNKDATNHQIAGALMALVNLGELDLAVSLLADLWPTGQVSLHVAGEILRSALESNSESTQENASTVLYQNPSLISNGSIHLWPIDSAGWRTDLTEDCRRGLVVAAAEWFAVELERGLRHADSLTVLYRALDDPNDIVAGVAAATLRPAIAALPATYSIHVTGSGWTTYADVRKKLEKRTAPAVSNFERQIERKISELVGNRGKNGAKHD